MVVLTYDSVVVMIAMRPVVSESSTDMLSGRSVPTGVCNNSIRRVRVGTETAPH